MLGAIKHSISKLPDTGDITLDTISQEKKNNKNKLIQVDNINFLEGWRININTIPSYSEFTNVFYEQLDKKILKLLQKEKSIKEDQQKILLRMITNIQYDNHLKVKHNQSCRKISLGRFYPDLSIISTCRKIKHTVFKYLGYTDIDMVCCHLSIALSIANMNDTKFDAISEYFLNKSAIVEDEIKYYSDENSDRLTPDDIKFKFNLLSYGGSESTWKYNIQHGIETDKPKLISEKESSKFTKKFKKDIKRLMKIIHENNVSLLNEIFVKYPDMSNEEEIYKNKCSLMAYFFQILENHILYNAYIFLRDKDVIKSTKVVLEYDGLCIPPAEFDKVQIINELNKYIQSKTKLKHVTFKIKEYTCAFDNVIEIRKKMSDNETDFAANDLDACKKILRLFPHWKCCGKKLYVFNRQNGMWMDEEKYYYNVIMQYEENLYVTTDKGTISNTKSYGNTTALMSKLPSLIKSLCIDDKWISENEHSSLGKILFNNGYYDMRLGIFYPKKDDGFDNYNILFFGSINYDYVNIDKDDAYMKYVKETLFDNPLGVMIGKFFLYILSRGLAGDELKNMLFGLGVTNGGKSLMTLALKEAFDDYIGVFNAENLSNKSSSGDEAQKNRWAYLLRYCRLLFSNEMKMTDNQKNDTIMDGNEIKKHSSGLDSLIGRLHNGNETKFVPHYLMAIFANDLPKIVPYDSAVDKRTIVFNYSKEFVDEPSNEFELKTDPDLSDKVRTHKFKNALANLYLTYFWVNYDLFVYYNIIKKIEKLQYLSCFMI